MIYLISKLDDHLENGKPLISTKTMVALSLVIVPAMTIGGLWMAAEAVSTAAATFTKKVSNALLKPVYLISSPFRRTKQALPEEMKDRALSE